MKLIVNSEEDVPMDLTIRLTTNLMHESDFHSLWYELQAHKQDNPDQNPCKGTGPTFDVAITDLVKELKRNCWIS